MKVMAAIGIAILMLSKIASAESISETNEDSASWTAVARGASLVLGGVGMLTMIVSGAVVADGLQEDCKKGFQDEVTCDPDEEQVESGLRWMGAGAILTVVGAATYGAIEWANRSAAQPEKPKEVPLRRTDEDVGNPIPVAP